MHWFRLAFHGTRRRPLRSALTTGGVAIAVAAAFSLLAFQHGYRKSLKRELDRLGAHILVVPKGCPYDAASLALHGANWPCFLKESYLEDVRSVPGVAAAAPVLMTAFYGTNGQATVYVGIDTNMLTLKPGWRLQGAFPNPGEVLVGADTARQRQWRPGQVVALPGLDRVSRPISGILKPTQSADDTFISLGLADAQRLFRHTNELTHVLVRLDDPNRLEAVVAALRGCGAGMHMNVVPVAHLFRTIQGLMNSTQWFLAGATLIALLAAAGGVTSTLLMAVAERTREIGVLRALGASRGGVFKLFCWEALQLCLGGALAGIVGAYALMHFVERWLRARLPFRPDGEMMIWEWWIVGGCLVIAMVLGTAAALLPAWRAAWLPPVQAIQHQGGIA